MTSPFVTVLVWLVPGLVLWALERLRYRLAWSLAQDQRDLFPPEPVSSFLIIIGCALPPVAIIYIVVTLMQLDETRRKMMQHILDQQRRTPS